jgi:hypothetical protein
MAQEMQIPGAGTTAKIRSPFAPALLPIITLAAGVEQLNGWIGLLLYLLLSPVFYAYMQSGLNQPLADSGAGAASKLGLGQ